MKRTPHLLQYELLLKKGESKLRSVLITDDCLLAHFSFYSCEEAVRWGATHYPDASVTQSVNDTQGVTLFTLSTTGLAGLPLSLVLRAPTHAITFDDLRASAESSRLSTQVGS